MFKNSFCVDKARERAIVEEEEATLTGTFGCGFCPREEPKTWAAEGKGQILSI